MYVKVPNSQSYEVQQKNFQNAYVDSYTIPLVIYDEVTYGVLNRISQKFKAHLNKPEVKQALKKRDLSTESMDKYYRKPSKNGNASAQLYPKFKMEFVTEEATPDNKLKITNKFFNSETDEQINPTTLINQSGKVRAAINMRYICIAAKPNIQLNVSDAIVLENHCYRN